MPTPVDDDFEPDVAQDAISNDDFVANAPQGQAPKSIQGFGASDASLGIDRGPETSVQVVPGITGTETPLAQPGSKAPTELQDRTTANNPLSGDPLARLIVGGILGHGAGAAVGGALEAVGAPAMVTAVGSGAAGGATASKVQGGSALTGAITGGALSGLMQFAGNRAAEQLVKRGVTNLMRKSSGEDAAAISEAGKQEMGQLMAKYKLGNMKNPITARDATDLGIKSAKAELESAQDAVRQAPVGGPLYNSSLARLRDVEKELAGLQTLRPIVNKLAVAHEMRMSMVERLASGQVGQVGRELAGKAMAAPVQAASVPFRAADIALAKLYHVKSLGQPITPELIATAQAAGVMPHVIDGLVNTQNQQSMSPTPNQPVGQPVGTQNY